MAQPTATLPRSQNGTFVPSTVTLALWRIRRTWRLLLIGIGIGLFSGPNQALLMSVGKREMMGAASALSNLGTRIGSVCGPLVVGLTWTLLASLSAQVGVGMLIIDGFAVLNLLFAWLAVQRRLRGTSPEEAPETASEGLLRTIHNHPSTEVITEWLED